MPSTDRSLGAILEAEVRGSDRTGYLAHLFAPESVRPALTALAAYRAELRRIVTRIGEPLAAEVRLQWWRDAIRGEGTGAVSGVPLVDALREGMARYAWPADTLAAASEAHIHDLYADPFADMDAFDGYAGETEGALTQLAAMALAIDAYGNADGLAAARTAATASGYAGVALVSAHAAVTARDGLARARTLIPESVWRAAGIDVGEAMAWGRTPDSVDVPIAAIGRHGQAADEAMRALLPSIDAAARPAFLRALTVRPTLAAAVRSPARLSPPAPWREQLRLWRAARTIR